MTDQTDIEQNEQKPKSSIIWPAFGAGMGAVLIGQAASKVLEYSADPTVGSWVAAVGLSAAGMFVGAKAMRKAIELSTPQGATLWANMMDGKWGARLAKATTKWRGALGLAVFVGGFVSTIKLAEQFSASGSINFSEKVALAGMTLVYMSAVAVTDTLKETYKEQNKAEDAPKRKLP